MEQVNSPSKVRFGLFEVDLQAEELRKSGIRIKVQSQPFKVLTLLLSRPGEVVTREELQQHLWGNQTTVDFDHSLGTAINKLREALGDSADNPRFIETLARRGYRFIAPVMAAVATPPEAAAPSAPLAAEPQTTTASAASVWAWKKLAIASAVLVLAGLAITAYISLYGGTLTPPLHISQITFSGRVSPGEPLQENLAATATDGSRIYFSQIEDGKTVLEQTLIADSESSPLNIPSEITSPSLGDISPDGSKLLVRDQHFPQVEQTLWIVPTLGGTARNFSTIPAHDGTWMSDDRRILYAAGTDLYTANEDGSNKQKFASLPDRAFWLRWSPDGSKLRFTLLNKLNHTASLWEISSSGKNLHPLLPNWSNPASECCGTWTADGKYYVFQSAHDSRNNLWALKEDSFLKSLSHPIQITNGPLSYQAPIASRTGEQLFFIGLDTRTVLLRYEPQAAQFVPYGKELNSAQLVSFSNDHNSVAWIRPEDSTLWRSHIDGTQRIQLTAHPMQVFMMHWSPDNKHIVLMGREPGKLWKLYLVDAQGGDLVPLLNETRNEADPGFSPDGNSVVFGRLPELMAEKSQPKSIYILNMKTQRITTLPHSEGYFSPRWSPDGRYIAAMTLDQSSLMLYDMTTSTWKILAALPARDPVWSHDGRWVYFHDFLADDQPIYRVSVLDGHIEHVAGMKSLQPLDIVDFRFAGLAPGDIPLVSARLSTANIYNVDLARK